MDKQQLRERVWDRLEEREVARFPFPPHGRIPNFERADRAADRLAATPAWRSAETMKANPDAPQRPVRRRALREDKTVFVAVPRLRKAACFLRLAPAEIADIDEATTVSGAAQHGEPTRPAKVPHIDLIVAGSVAVDERGVRVGKGEGYSDLEYALLYEFDRISADTPVATTVHELQVVTEELTPSDHDVPLDLIVTPERVIETNAAASPVGIDWSLLDAEDREAMPILQELWEAAH